MAVYVCEHSHKGSCKNTTVGAHPLKLARHVLAHEEDALLQLVDARTPLDVEGADLGGLELGPPVLACIEGLGLVDDRERGQVLARRGGRGRPRREADSRESRAHQAGMGRLDGRL